MPRIMITCPVTQKPVYTGTSTNTNTNTNTTKLGLDISKYGSNTFGPCPSCGQAHTWDKNNAYLESEGDKKHG